MSKQLNREAGFTLVELAVVMIIIGLLIGGVLKGQELIGNAQVTSTVSQVKGIDAATSTFRDMYSALPGDMAQTAIRLPNCAAAPCSTAGNGDGSLGNLANAAPGGEGLQFFVHLSAADLITGIDPGGPANAWGTVLPESPIRGVGLYAAQGDAASLLAAAVGARRGLYLTLTGLPNGLPTAAGGPILTPNQASRIDTKLDDGVPAAGSVRANAGACVNGVAYNELNGNGACFLQIRIQG